MSKKRIILTSRDKAILGHLFEQKVVFFEEIHQKFFSNLHLTTCFARLNKLVVYNLISKMGIGRNGKLMSYFCLTRLGLKEISEIYSFECQRVRLKSDSLMHDLELSSFRNYLEQKEMVKKYYAENFLQNCSLCENETRLMPLRDINADAGLLLTGNSGDFIVSFEYERSLKSSSKYVRKITDYYFNSSITAVFYLCETENINRIIRQIDKEVGGSFFPKIFTLSVQQMEHSKEFLAFKNQKGGIFNLR